MANTICVPIIYFMEIINLCAFAKYIYGIQLKNNCITTIIGIFSVFEVLLFNIAAEKFLSFRQFPFFTFIISFAFSILMLDKKRQILKMLSAVLIIKIASMLLWLGGVSLNLIRYDNFKYPPAFLIINCIITVGTFVLIRLAKKQKRAFLLADYSRKELFYFVSGEIALILILSVITEFSSHYSSISEIGIPIITISSGIMVFICYHMLSVKYENRSIKIEQDATIKMLSAQENYYKMLLKKEEQTKAFRHDIRNHLYCMKALCDSNEYIQLQEYINTLNESQADINTNLTSGYELVDVIINDLISTYQNVKLRIFGVFSEKYIIEQVDICTIFSNLLTNAFEAAEKNDDKIVRLHIKRLNSNLLISIQNSVCKMPIIENNDIKTSKSDTGHGYGLKNVKTSLTKYGGKLELKCENNIFEASVIIPNALEY